MTDREKVILMEAIKKAVKGGFVPPVIELVYQPRSAGKNTMWTYFHRGIIFSHEFAKAFWKGEPCTCIPEKKDGAIYHLDSCGIRWYAWKDCLRTMVIKENPIKYLEKFL